MVREPLFLPAIPAIGSIPGRLALLLGILPVVAVAQAETGKTLFESRCARCHDGPASLKTEPDRVAALLRAGTVRQHRFTLSGTQLSAIAEYLRTARSRP